MGNNEGLTGGVEVSVPIAMTMAAFTAIAWINVTELNIHIFVRFKVYRSLYFWALLISSWGTFLHAISFLFKFFMVIRNGWVSSTLITIGWYCMVTGQSLVLYSRLNLIEDRSRVLRFVLYMIIADVFLLHVPTTVLTFGSNSSDAARYAYPYTIMEKIQMTGFFLQESIISGIYVYNAVRIFKPVQAFRKRRIRRIMLHLAAVNILIILMDVALLTTEYLNLYDIQTTFKAMIYSIKLKLEFAILTDLIGWSRGDASFNSAALSQPGQEGSRVSRPYVSFGGEAAEEKMENGVQYNPSSTSKVGYSCGAIGREYWEKKHTTQGSGSMKTTEVFVETTTRDLGSAETIASDCELPIMPFEGEKEESTHALTGSIATFNRPSYAQQPSFSPRPSSEIHFVGKGS